MPSNTVIHKKHLAIAISAALAGVSPMAWSACSPVGTTFIVDTASDVVDGFDGVLSFREAINASNGIAGCDTITFDAALTGPIILDVATNGDRIDIIEDLNIVGPGSAALTIEKESTGGFAMFNHCNGDLDISGLTLDGKNNTNNYQGLRSSESTSGGCSAIISPAIDSVIIDDIVVQNFMPSGGGGSATGITINNVETVSITNSASNSNARDGISIGQTEQLTISNVTTNDNEDRGIQVSSGANTNASLTAITSTSNNSGGIYISTSDNGNIAIADSTLSDNNKMFGDGAGIEILISGDTDVSISNTTIDNNTHTGTGDGGGVFARYTSTAAGASLTVENSTISNNTVTDGDGGGLFIQNDQVDVAITINQSTVSGNTAADGTPGFPGFGEGGGIYFGNYSSSCCPPPATITTEPSINFSTITDNTGTRGGGIFYNDYNSDLNLSHTVIAGNTGSSSAPDVYHESGFNYSINALYSFIGEDNPSGSPTPIVNVQDSTPANTSMIGAVGLPIDPILDVLADNGGDTLTHAPINGSQLLDGGDMTLQAGVGNTPATDQRGRTRVAFTGIDIGAVEFNTNTAPTLSTPIDAATATIGTAFSINLDDYFTDAEMDPISYSVLSITPIIPSGAWAISGNLATGTFQAGDAGTYTVVYQACDTEPLCTTGSGTLTIQAGGGGSSGGLMLHPLLAGLMAAVMGLIRLRRK